MKKAFMMLALMYLSVSALSAHEIISGKFSSNGLYPGTSRGFQVYIPSQYKGDKPACLYVNMDGMPAVAPQVLDSLIEAKKIPVIIGVFIGPGEIKNSQGKVVRWNRSNEYDMTDGRLAQFIDSELLPFIEATVKTKGGLPVKISKDGNDRMIVGGSSGGIAAFVAAWMRPDLFSRAASAIGTFVAMRGGNDLQAIVRKSEPKPIRFYMQDNDNDVWNPLFGHWYENNLLLASALKFAGADADYAWDEGGHSDVNFVKRFADIMVWMWNGWPSPLTRGDSQNDYLKSVLETDRNWTLKPKKEVVVASADSVSARYPDNSLAVVKHAGTNCLWQYIVKDDGTLDYGQRFYWLHTMDNSAIEVGPMAFDSNGFLYVVTNWGIQVCDQNGRVRGILELPKGDARHQPFAVKRCVKIVVLDGALELALDDGRVYTRPLKVKTPTPGVTPATQGAG